MADEVLPVLPVLAYSNPQGAQPVGGRLLVSHSTDELILTDPRSAATSPRLLKWIGIITVAYAGWTELANILAIRNNPPGQMDHRLIAVGIPPLAMGVGILVFFLANRQKQNPRVIRLARGRVYTSGCPGHGWASGRFIARRFFAKATSTDLRTMRPGSDLYVQYRFGFSLRLFTNLVRDEATWAVQLLEDALKETRTLPD